MSTPRPGGRSAVVKMKAFDAAQKLAIDKGLHNVTLPDIAKLAGIAPTSLYRRWGDVGSLLMEMAVERLSDSLPLPDEGSITADLTVWARRIARGLTADQQINFFRVLLATTDMTPDERKQALAPRVEQFHQMLARSEARGEMVPKADEVLDHVLAPLYMRALTGMPVDEAYAEGLVARLLGAMRD